MEKTITELLNFGIMIIDKPTGPTSFTISDFIRKNLKLSKTSHFGTLDPMVTGVLPIALGRACRLTGIFLGHDKTYVGIMHTHKEQDIKELQEIINKNFMGVIKQLPPKKSRVKRAIREREIKRFELIEVSEDKKDFLFISEVQGGTYIRKLCSELGEMIGGAHMAELRRTHAGIFSEKDKQFTNLYNFEKAAGEHTKGNSKNLKQIIIPAEEAIKMVLPEVQVKENIIFNLKTGKPLFKRDIPNYQDLGERFAVFCKEKFIGIYKRVKENDIIGRAEFVFN